jgi:hypothetical protein
MHGIAGGDNCDDNFSDNYNGAARESRPCYRLREEAQDKLSRQPGPASPVDAPAGRSAHAPGRRWRASAPAGVAACGMAAMQLLQDRCATQMRVRGQHRDDLALPHLRQRIDPRPPGRPACTLARKSRSTLVAPSAALAEPRSRRRHQLRGSLPPLIHVSSHLIIGDPSPRHRPVLRNCRGHPDPESQSGHRACRQAVTLMDAVQSGPGLVNRRRNVIPRQRASEMPAAIPSQAIGPSGMRPQGLRAPLELCRGPVSRRTERTRPGPRSSG